MASEGDPTWTGLLDEEVPRLRSFVEDLTAVAVSEWVPYYFTWSIKDKEGAEGDDLVWEGMQIVSLLYSSERLLCFVIFPISACWNYWLIDWLIDWHYSWGFMEWWDNTGSPELVQQQEWALFLVTTLKCCVFVCPSLFVAVLTVAYTHTDGYHSLGWRSNSPLFVYGHNETTACFFQMSDPSIPRMRKFWDKVYLNVYHARIFWRI